MTYPSGWGYLYIVQKGLKYKKADECGFQKESQNMDQLKNANKKGLRRTSSLIEVVLRKEGEDVTIREVREALE